MFTRLALTPAGTKVLQYLQAKFPKVTFEQSPDQSFIIAQIGNYQMESLLTGDKWTELHNEDYDAPTAFKRQNMALTVDVFNTTAPDPKSGKPTKVRWTKIVVQDKVVLPPAQAELAKWKKDLFGNLSNVEAHVSSGSLTWSMRRGHQGANIISAVVARALKLGFKQTEFKPGNSPDGDSHFWSGTIYTGPHGEALKTYANYGVWAPDNYFSMEFRLPKKG